MIELTLTSETPTAPRTTPQQTTLALDWQWTDITLTASDDCVGCRGNKGCAICIFD